MHYYVPATTEVQQLRDRRAPPLSAKSGDGGRWPSLSTSEGSSAVCGGSVSPCAHSSNAASEADSPNPHHSNVSKQGNCYTGALHQRHHHDKQEDEEEAHLLNELQATAIAGNDIASSCLYATGIIAASAGKYGFLASALVCLVLYFFRGIYAEVFSALPTNGGTYSALLSVASSKRWAALAAVLSTLSYTATAVTSAASAADYLHYGFPFIPALPTCVGVLCLFALLTLLGLKDSAKAAAFLFVTHLVCMGLLIAAAFLFCARDGFATLRRSWASSSPLADPYAHYHHKHIDGVGGTGVAGGGGRSGSNSIPLLLDAFGNGSGAGSVNGAAAVVGSVIAAAAAGLAGEDGANATAIEGGFASAAVAAAKAVAAAANGAENPPAAAALLLSFIVSSAGSWLPALFFGYGSALLGVTGFETSANYIEEQRPGVFAKTLRNMWAVITVLNPTLCLLAMGVVPIEELVRNGNYSLAFVANTAGGEWLRTLVVIDSFLVLSGAVLTAYVGIVGMHRRLALDRVMPSIFLKTNTFRGTNHYIIIGFCALTVSLRLAVAQLDTLGGVYAISFLSVMMLFCVSNVLLKRARGRLRRSPIVHAAAPILGCCAVLVGFIANLARDSANARFFFIYFAGFSALVCGTMMRVPLLRLVASAAASAAAFFSPHSHNSHSRSGSITCASKSGHAACLTAAGWARGAVAAIRADCPTVAFFVPNTAASSSSSLAAMLREAARYVEANEDARTLRIIHCLGGGGEDDSTNRSSDVLFVRSTVGNTKMFDGMGTPPISPKQTAKIPAGSSVTYDPTRTRTAEGTTLGSIACGRDERAEAFMEKLEHECAALDRLCSRVTIEVAFVGSPFTPATVDAIARDMSIPKNYMFIGCFGEGIDYAIGEFGGLRIICD